MEKVIVVVRSALLDLKLAIDGTIIMNEVIRLLFLLHHCSSPWPTNFSRAALLYVFVFLNLCYVIVIL